jgi:hypothetical protein
MAEVTHTLVPVFKTLVTPDEQASKTAGRPIFREMEVVEIRFPGNRQSVPVFPAHDHEPNATRESMAQGGEPITYAMHFSKQYQQFKSSQTQTVSGTPVEELPFVTASKRSELKALNIHTAEALASLDGTPLKQLGMGGRELKVQAQAYLDNAAGTADVTALAAQVAALQQQIADRDDLIKNYATTQGKNKYQRGVEKAVAERAEAERDAGDAADEPGEADAEAEANEAGEAKALEDCTDAELKAYIKRETGSAIRGNPNRDTLMEAARAIASGQVQ